MNNILASFLIFAFLLVAIAAFAFGYFSHPSYKQFIESNERNSAAFSSLQNTLDNFLDAHCEFEDA